MVPSLGLSTEASQLQRLASHFVYTHAGIPSVHWLVGILRSVLPSFERFLNSHCSLSPVSYTHLTLPTNAEV